MKISRKIPQISILFLIFAILLSGCSGVTTPATNLSGKWTTTNTTTFTTSTYLADIGAVTTAKCNIVDNSGSLTIYNFHIIGQPFIKWNTGYGTFKNSIITANISGSYLNVYGSTVSTIVYFEGTINSSGISGSGTWVQTVSVYGYFDSASGTTIFIKG